MAAPHVLLIAKDYPPSIGGAEMYNANMVRGLLEAGHTVTVATWTPSDSELPTTSGERLTVVRLSDVRLRGPRPASRIPPLLAEHRPDVAWVSPSSRHLTDVHDVLVGASIPTIATCHFFRSKHARRGWIGRRKARNRLHLDRVDAVVTVSAFLESQLQRIGVPKERLSVVSPGVDTQRFSPDRERRTAIRSTLGFPDAPVLLTVARLVEGKGHERVLATLGALHARGCHAHYLIVGDGPDRPKIEHRVQELRLADSVRFVGQVDDPRPYYDAADVVVMPSGNEEWNEAFGMSFVEAGAMERPVVASRDSGAEDIVLEGQTGHLVDPEDQDALSTSVLNCLEAQSAYGRAARSHVEERFTWTRSAEQLSLLFHDLSSRREPSRDG
ncbi:MAG: glycosyltransferase family 4 protein [Planctomycetota bacterium]